MPEIAVQQTLFRKVIHVRRSKTLEKLRANKPVRMCALGHYIPPFVRHAAHYGFDCIWLDLEHRAMSDREVQSLLVYFHLFDIDCMVRPPTLEKTRLYRYLEDGATGLMIPHVSTVERARELVQAVKFPPLGDRGLDGAGLDTDFLLAGGPDYIDQANRETFLVVQIETPLAVENVDQIAAVDGVDGLFLGPGDLGLRLQRGSSPFSNTAGSSSSSTGGGGPATLDQARGQVAEAASRHGKAWGCPASPEQLESLYAEGARLLAHGGDFMACMNMLQQSSQRLDSVYGP